MKRLKSVLLVVIVGILLATFTSDYWLPSLVERLTIHIIPYQDFGGHKVFLPDMRYNSALTSFQLNNRYILDLRVKLFIQVEDEERGKGRWNPWMTRFWLFWEVPAERDARHTGEQMEALMKKSHSDDPLFRKPIHTPIPGEKVEV